MSRNKRRKKFIDSKVQGALVRRITCHFLIFFGTSCTFAFFLQVLSNPLAPLSQHFKQLWWTQGPFIVTAICLLPVFLRDTVTLSHRFVGPILRVRSTMQQVSRGDKTPLVQLRPDDFWTDLADDMNSVLAFINGQRNDTGTSQTEEATTS